VSISQDRNLLHCIVLLRTVGAGFRLGMFWACFCHEKLMLEEDHHNNLPGSLRLLGVMAVSHRISVFSTGLFRFGVVEILILSFRYCFLSLTHEDQVCEKKTITLTSHHAKTKDFLTRALYGLLRNSAINVSISRDQIKSLCPEFSCGTIGFPKLQEG
jgi:hypothetical protein